MGRYSIQNQPIYFNENDYFQYDLLLLEVNETNQAEKKNRRREMISNYLKNQNAPQLRLRNTPQSLKSATDEYDANEEFRAGEAIINELNDNAMSSMVLTMQEAFKNSALEEEVDITEFENDALDSGIQITDRYDTVEPLHYAKTLVRSAESLLPPEERINLLTDENNETLESMIDDETVFSSTQDNQSSDQSGILGDRGIVEIKRVLGGIGNRVLRLTRAAQTGFRYIKDFETLMMTGVMKIGYFVKKTASNFFPELNQVLPILKSQIITNGVPLFMALLGTLSIYTLSGNSPIMDIGNKVMLISLSQLNLGNPRLMGFITSIDGTTAMNVVNAMLNYTLVYLIKNQIVSKVLTNYPRLRVACENVLDIYASIILSFGCANLLKYLYEFAREIPNFPVFSHLSNIVEDIQDLVQRSSGSDISRGILSHMKLMARATFSSFANTDPFMRYICTSNIFRLDYPGLMFGRDMFQSVSETITPFLANNVGSALGYLGTMSGPLLSRLAPIYNGLNVGVPIIPGTLRSLASTTNNLNLTRIGALLGIGPF